MLEIIFDFAPQIARMRHCLDGQILVRCQIDFGEGAIVNRQALLELDQVNLQLVIG